MQQLCSKDYHTKYQFKEEYDAPLPKTSSCNLQLLGFYAPDMTQLRQSGKNSILLRMYSVGYIKKGLSCIAFLRKTAQDIKAVLQERRGRAMVNSRARYISMIG